MATTERNISRSIEALKAATTAEITISAEKAIKRTKEDQSALYNYLTQLRIDQLKADQITRAEAEAIAEKKIRKEAAKNLAAKLAKIDNITAAKETRTAAIYVNWVRSSVWGMNPHAELFSDTGNSSGKASGCGYDKLSAAMAETLNQNNGIMKRLYLMKGLQLADDATITSHRACGYGSGYGALPYFEGGVGASSLIHVLEKIGYAVEWNSGNKRDTFIITLPEAHQLREE